MKVHTVERVSNLSVDKFEEEYLNGNKPVIIENYMTEWPALHWTLAKLRHKAGHNQVFVRRRTAEETYRAGLKYDIESMLFSEYVGNMENHDPKSYNSYLAVQNIRKALPELEEDIEVPEYVKKLHGGPFLWLAQKGHYEFCHFDPDDNILIVFSGEKHVKLYSACHLDKMYPNALGSRGKTIQSSINCRDPDLEKYPKFKDVECFEVFFRYFFKNFITKLHHKTSFNYRHG